MLVVLRCRLYTTGVRGTRGAANQDRGPRVDWSANFNLLYHTWMPAYLTVLGQRSDRAEVWRIVHALGLPVSPIPKYADQSTWSTIHIEQGGATLRLSWRDVEQNRAEISQMRSGMTGYFRRASAADPAVRRRAMQTAGSFVCAVGIVAEPDFRASGDYDLVWAIREAVQGHVWNGTGLVLPDGRLLLDGEGNSDLHPQGGVSK